MLTTSGSGGSDICLSVDVLIVISRLGTMKGSQSLIDRLNQQRALTANKRTVHTPGVVSSFPCCTTVEIRGTHLRPVLSSTFDRLPGYVESHLKDHWRNYFLFLYYENHSVYGRNSKYTVQNVVVQWPKNMRAISSMRCYKHTCFMLRYIS